MRVAVTARDVARLTAATGLAAAELVTWLEPDEVDMSGEPQSFVELREGRRLMVLAQRAGACALLGTDDRCRVYEARPRDCRAFPFDFELTADGKRHLRLLERTDCDHDRDGAHDERELAREDAERWQELAEFQKLVATWNRQMWHRKRLKKGLPSGAEFLATVLREAVSERP